MTIYESSTVRCWCGPVQVMWNWNYVFQTVQICIAIGSLQCAIWWFSKTCRNPLICKYVYCYLFTYCAFILRDEEKPMHLHGHYGAANDRDWSCRSTDVRVCTCTYVYHSASVLVHIVFACSDASMHAPFTCSCLLFDCRVSMLSLCFSCNAFMLPRIEAVVSEGIGQREKQ